MERRYNSGYNSGYHSGYNSGYNAGYGPGYHSGNNTWVILLLCGIGGVLLIGVIVLIMVLSRGGSRLQKELDLGARYLDEMDYEQAVIHFDNAIDIDDRSDEAYLGRGDAYLGLEEYPQAQEDYTTAIQLNEDNVDAYVGLAYTYSGQDQKEEAHDTVDDAVEHGLPEEDAEDVHYNIDNNIIPPPGRVEDDDSDRPTPENEQEEIPADDTAADNTEPVATHRPIRTPERILTADDLSWVVEPTYDYEQVIPLRSTSFTTSADGADGTTTINGKFYEASFSSYSSLPEYYGVQLSDGSWQVYYMPDHTDSSQALVDLPSTQNSTAGEDTVAGLVDMMTELFHEGGGTGDALPPPWNVLNYLESSVSEVKVYYDLYSGQGLLKSGLENMDFMPMAQADLHKPYPAGLLSTENTGVDATQPFHVSFSGGDDGNYDVVVDYVLFNAVLSGQTWDYPQGYIGPDGQPITDFIYDRAENFSEGIAACYRDGGWGYIDETGAELTDFVYGGVWADTEYNFDVWEEDVWYAAYPCTCDTMVVWQDGEVGLLYRDGSVLIDFGQFEDMAPAWNDELWAKQNGLWGLIDLADAKVQAGVEDAPAVTEAETDDREEDRHREETADWVPALPDESRLNKEVVPGGRWR